MRCIRALAVQIDAGDGNEEMAGSNLATSSSSDSQRHQQLQQLRGGEQDSLLLNSAAVMNRRFSLLDILRETFNLAQARRTYLLVFLPIFIVGVLLLNCWKNYLYYGTRLLELAQYHEEILFCEENILEPWKEAAMRKNLTDTQQDEFYTLFQQNCTMFKSPAEELGTMTFRNGTLQFTSQTGFVLALHEISPHFFGGVGQLLMNTVWISWGLVAVTWGLHFATTRTMAYRPPQSRDTPLQTKSSPSQTLTEVLRELFAFRVLKGVLRASLTGLYVHIVTLSTGMLVTAVVLWVNNKPVNLAAYREVEISQGDWANRAMSIPFIFFVLSNPAAALEMGTWGFRAMWRGIEMVRGNRLTSYLLFLVLLLWSWLNLYLNKLVSLKSTEVVTWSWWRVMAEVSITLMGLTPELFLVPVLYFHCKSWEDRLATMA